MSSVENFSPLKVEEFGHIISVLNYILHITRDTYGGFQLQIKFLKS